MGLQQELTRILTDNTVVAVLGAHDVSYKAAHYVPAYLHDAGYQIWSVNPHKLGMTMWERPVYATLAELPEPIDLVDVFRRPDQLQGHVADILAMDPLPKVVWFQQGIRNDAVADQLRAAGIEVIQDRCTLADHRALGL